MHAKYVHDLAVFTDATTGFVDILLLSLAVIYLQFWTTRLPVTDSRGYVPRDLPFTQREFHHRDKTTFTLHVLVLRDEQARYSLSLQATSSCSAIVQNSRQGLGARGGMASNRHRLLPTGRPLPRLS